MWVGKSVIELIRFRYVLFVIAALFCPAALPCLAGVDSVTESARQLPVVKRVDVVVVGGTTGGVAAAVEAAQNGSDVFLAAPRPYLGEDMCGTGRLWNPSKKPLTGLSGRIFAREGFVRPMHVKRVLDEALIDAGVDYLFGCYVTELLRDEHGRLGGIVMVNRAGRQAVIAKTIIDATDRAWVARKAGGEFYPYPAGPQEFRRVVVGGEVHNGLHIESRLPGFQVDSHPVIEYELTIQMADGSFASLAKAEQTARDKTDDPNQVDASEFLFQVPPDPVRGQKSQAGPWRGAENLEIGAFRPKGIDRLFILGGCADISRAAAGKLIEPANYIAAGKRIGKAASRQAGDIATLRGVKLAGSADSGVSYGDVRENLQGIRPINRDLPQVKAERRKLPVLGEYDVVIIGGGTAGAPAGIAAARRGAKTLVIEYLDDLGGVGTMGFIGKYWYGYREGFTAEIDEAVGGPSWRVEEKKQWYRRQLRRAGGEIWFQTIGCGAYVEQNRLTGAVVATPEQRGVVLAEVVIDSTGNADIAAVAGAECEFTSAEHIAIQGAGLPAWNPGDNYNNTDYAFVHDTDAKDAWHLFVWAKRKFAKAYDLAQMLDTRERRRIVGDFRITPMDIINRRTYPDTIVLARSNFDSHGFTVHPYFTILPPPHRDELSAYVPYRCLLPRGLDGILVTGLGISAHRDAMPVIRMQADVQNQGYAAGIAAAMAAQNDVSLREIDIDKLQQHLVDKGNLPAEILDHTDSYPFTARQIEGAVDKFLQEKDYQSLAMIFAQPEDALGLLKKRYHDTDTPAQGKLRAAQILAVHGDDTGVETLISKVKSFEEWDQGWDYTGMGQFGPSMSELDGYIIALGQCGTDDGLKTILQKARLLDAETAFSHHRAIAVSVEKTADPSAAKTLFDVLSKPGMTGHVVTNLEQASKKYGFSPVETGPRNKALRELVLARALYRCGDYHSLGSKILRKYNNDLRGHFARHAQAVLNGK